MNAITAKPTLLRLAIVDVALVVLACLVPTLSHITALPLYRLNPMLLFILSGMLLVADRRNAVALALLLPLVSMLVVGMPAPAKALCMIVEYSAVVLLYTVAEIYPEHLVLDGNHPLTVIENGSAGEDAPTLLLVKDSFGNSLAPLLVPSYKTIVMVDPRYYRQSLVPVCEQYGIDELLFCYSIERITTDLSLKILK